MFAVSSQMLSVRCSKRGRRRRACAKRWWCWACDAMFPGAWVTCRSEASVGVSRRRGPRRSRDVATASKNTSLLIFIHARKDIFVIALERRRRAHDGFVSQNLDMDSNAAQSFATADQKSSQISETPHACNPCNQRCRPCSFHSHDRRITSHRLLPTPGPRTTKHLYSPVRHLQPSHYHPGF